MGRSRKPLSAQALRGFESPSLRHTVVTMKRGDVAQLGEHLVRNEGVGGSSPLISTILLGLSEVVLDGEVAVPYSRNPL
jgi:hypothetical protein